MSDDHTCHLWMLGSCDGVVESVHGEGGRERWREGTKEGGRKGEMEGVMEGRRERITITIDTFSTTHNTNRK